MDVQRLHRLAALLQDGLDHLIPVHGRIALIVPHQVHPLEHDHQRGEQDQRESGGPERALAQARIQLEYIFREPDRYVLPTVGVHAHRPLLFVLQRDDAQDGGQRADISIVLFHCIIFCAPDGDDLMAAEIERLSPAVGMEGP